MTDIVERLGKVGLWGEAREEILRLRAEVASLTGRLAKSCDEGRSDPEYPVCSRAAASEAERDRLRAEVAEARELLREARSDWIKVGYGASHEDVAECRDLCGRIDAALKEKP